MPHNLEQITSQIEHDTLVLQRDARPARRLVDFDGTDIVVR